MAVLLVGIAVMSILLSVAMPVWHQQMQREKEAELIFRGEQYAHAIILFQHKYGAALPPNIQVLLDQKFLRRKYKDPMTGKDFRPIYQAQAAQFGARPGTTGPTTPVGTGVGGTSPAPSTPKPSTPTAPSTPGAGMQVSAGPQGGLVGVVSTSTEKSIRIYNGYDHYNQWAFLYTNYVQPNGPGGLQPGAKGQPGRPGQPTQPGGRGATPPQPPKPGVPGVGPQPEQ